MEKGKIRMLANLIELNKIEVRLSKKYYGGISPKFYLRDLNKETLVEIPVAETCEDDICVKYYFYGIICAVFVAIFGSLMSGGLDLSHLISYKFRSHIGTWVETVDGARLVFNANTY